MQKRCVEIIETAPLTDHSLFELNYGLLDIGVNISEEEDCEHVMQFKEFENLHSTDLSLLEADVTMKEGFRMNFENFGIIRKLFLLLMV